MNFSRSNPSPRYRELAADVPTNACRSGAIRLRRLRTRFTRELSLAPHASRIKRLVSITGAANLLDYGSGKGRQYQIGTPSARRHDRRGRAGLLGRGLRPMLRSGVSSVQSSADREVRRRHQHRCPRTLPGRGYQLDCRGSVLLCDPIRLREHRELPRFDSTFRTGRTRTAPSVQRNGGWRWWRPLRRAIPRSIGRRSSRASSRHRRDECCRRFASVAERLT